MSLVYQVTTDTYYSCETEEGPCELSNSTNNGSSEMASRSASRGRSRAASRSASRAASTSEDRCVDVTIYAGLFGLTPCRFFVAYDPAENKLVASTCPYTWSACTTDSQTSPQRILLRTHTGQWLNKQLVGGPRSDAAYFQMPQGHALDKQVTYLNQSQMPVETMEAGKWKFQGNLKVKIVGNGHNATWDRFAVCTSSQNNQSYNCGARETYPGHANWPSDCTRTSLKQNCVK